MRERYNHVGRPAKDKKNKKKNKGKIKGLIVITIMLVTFGIIYIVLDRKNIDFSSIMSNSSTFNNIILVNDKNYKLVFNYSNDVSNALQGSTYVDKNIYFSTATTNSDSDNKTKVFTYNFTTKQIIELASFSNFYATNSMKSYKINDITTADGRNYYASYSTNKTKPISNVVLSMNSIIRRANYNNDLENKYFVGLSYSTSYKKFYSLYGAGGYLRLYAHSIDASYNSSTASIGDGSYYILDPQILPSEVVSQGITIKGKFLYCVTQDANSGINYINVYDLRTGKEKSITNPIKLVRKINLGRNKSRYELESIFFVENNLYLGYNNYDYTNMSFYRINTSNVNITTNLALTYQNDEKTIITGTAKNNSKFGIYIYSFCEDKTGKECKWKYIKNKLGEYILSNNVNIKKTITKKGSSKWYFLVKDMFGNNKVSNYVQVKMN